MKGDFSRLNLFDPLHQYTRVMSQQGRVQLDADWNEQADILLHYLRTLAADLIGPFGAPANPDGTPGDGFRPAPRLDAKGNPVPGDFVLLPGRYYVGGIACQSAEAWVYSDRSGQLPPANPNGATTYMLYLDVWERHVIYLQDEALREVALGGADTATRARVVCQVRAVTETLDQKSLTAETTCQAVRRGWTQWVERWQPEHRGLLAAQAKTGTPDDTDPCLSSPDARYRGENQLYRVEIHTGGPAAAATFKWSSDNGSVVYPVLTLERGSGTATATLEHLGRDDRSGLTQGDWVEIADGEEDLRDGIDPLLQVDKIDPDTMVVTLKGTLQSTIGKDASKPLWLRRWDHRRSASKDKPNAAGVFPVQEGKWLDLEDGVQIFFAPAPDGATETYRSGDYWLIPARVATGDVVWPKEEKAPNDPKALPPHGVEHRYAPLGLVTLQGTAVTLKDCRTTFGCRVTRLDTGVAGWQVLVDRPPTGPVRQLASVVTNPDTAWGKIPGASWISFSPDANGKANTLYKYELSFDLCSCSRNPEISLAVMADNSAKVYLNEQLISAPPIASAKEPPTTIDKTDQTLFRAGGNVLRVEVTSGDGPTGFILSGLVDADGGGCC